MKHIFNYMALLIAKIAAFGVWKPLMLEASLHYTFFWKWPRWHSDCYWCSLLRYENAVISAEIVCFSCWQYFNLSVLHIIQLVKLLIYCSRYFVVVYALVSVITIGPLDCVIKDHWVFNGGIWNPLSILLRSQPG